MLRKCIECTIMERAGCVFVCLCVGLLAGTVLGQVGSLCRPKERFLSCGGCQKTCRNPAPDCKGLCKVGCYCDEDEVRNDTGHCVKLADCPVMLSKLQTTEPRSSDSECPVNEEYRFCEPCNKTCDNPNPMCPAQCARGCFCVEGLYRNREGRCVELDKCFKNDSDVIKSESLNLIKPLVYQLTCGPHQSYQRCQKCERTCSSARPVCTAACSAGCFCQDGYLKAPSGNCVKLEDCPKEKCGDPNEENVCRYGCEARCDARKCRYRPRRCTLGCHCRLGWLRDVDGRCVEPTACSNNRTQTHLNFTTKQLPWPYQDFAEKLLKFVIPTNFSALWT